MNIPSQLPEAEFEIMQIVWSSPSPLTTAQIAELAQSIKSWHFSTIKTLLRRLMTRGFLHGEKLGNELHYTPLVSQEDYIKTETEIFMEKYHKRSLFGLMRAMYSDKKIDPKDIAEIEEWLDSIGGD